MKKFAKICLCLFISSSLVFLPAYTVLATDENNRTFTLRVNNYVKEYSHNTSLILSEGDTISARSSNVILR